MGGLFSSSGPFGLGGLPHQVIGGCLFGLAASVPCGRVVDGAWPDACHVRRGTASRSVRRAARSGGWAAPRPVRSDSEPSLGGLKTPPPRTPNEDLAPQPKRRPDRSQTFPVALPLALVHAALPHY